jgi:plastocyanin
MTVRAKNNAIVAAVAIGMAVLAVTLLPMIASSELDRGRDVHLVIRDMAFYVDGDGTPNPTLTFKAGERVRVFVRNEDAGMNHDFVVKDWKIKSKTIHGRGETELTIKVPRRARTASYYCTPHAGKMRGTISVE